MLEVEIALSALKEIFGFDAYTEAFCHRNGFKTLSSILSYYEPNQTFSLLNRIKPRIEADLNRIIMRYQISRDTNEVRLEKDIPLSKIAGEENMSVRSYNVCTKNKLESINDIIRHYQTRRTFLVFRHSGIKTEIELSRIAEKYIAFIGDESSIDNLRIPNTYPSIPLKSYSEQLASFTPFKLAITNKYFDSQVAKLSTRSKNAIQKIVDTNNSKVQAIGFLANYNNDFSNIRNVGINSVQELNSLRNNLAQFITKIEEFRDIDVKSGYLDFIITSAFHTIDNLKDTLQEIYIDNCLLLFRLLYLLVENNEIVEQKQIEIFKSIFYKSGTKDFDALAAIMGISKERVRQLSHQIREQFESKLEFVTSIDLSDIKSYELDVSKPINVVSFDFGEHVNRTEGVNFNGEFYSIVLKKMFSKSHVLLERASV
ncbi:MAG: hypothetical protein EOO43_18930, partial [Flavobacterium sp.]